MTPAAALALLRPLRTVPANTWPDRIPAVRSMIATHRSDYEELVKLGMVAITVDRRIARLTERGSHFSAYPATNSIWQEADALARSIASPCPPWVGLMFECIYAVEWQRLEEARARQDGEERKFPEP